MNRRRIIAQRRFLQQNLPLWEEKRGIKRGSGILPVNDALISPLSPFFARHYLIAEWKPSQRLFVKSALSELNK
jgi:hypothetical protein